jgi:hypothetical protein
LSRVAYNRPFSQVGFRPTRRTDPFAAAHRLSGLGDGAGVPDQSIVAYSGQWMTDFSSSPQDVLNQVSSALGSDGLNVIRSSISTSLASTAEAALTGSGTLFGISLSIRVNNGMGFAQATDVASIVNHEVYQATGHMPASSTAAIQALPGTPEATDAMKPKLPGDFTTWIENNATWLLLGVGAILVLPQLVKKL